MPQSAAMRSVGAYRREAAFARAYGAVCQLAIDRLREGRLLDDARDVLGGMMAVARATRHEAGRHTRDARAEHYWREAEAALAAAVEYQVAIAAALDDVRAAERGDFLT